MPCATLYFKKNEYCAEKMKWQLLQFSLVVIAADNNPTILNPDFLRVQGIVPDSLGLELTGPPIATPQFANVQYTHGVTITVEPKKIQVADNELSEPSESCIQNILKEYIRVVPHVSYQAVGINFKMFSELANSKKIVRDNFIKSSVVESLGSSLQSAVVKFIYDSNDFTFNLTLEGGGLVKAEKPKDILAGIVVGANFHVNLEQKQGGTIDQIHSAVDKYTEAWEELSRSLKKLFDKG